MITQIQQLLCTPDSTDVSAFLLCTCCESMQLKLGLAGELFDAPTCFQVVVTQSWLKQIWLTTQSLNISIHLGIQQLLPPYVGNIEIMHVFLQGGYRNPKELHSLNCCCNFLHAFWLLDICTGTSDSINHQVWLSHTPYLSNLNWPWQPTLSAADWQLWHLALSSALHLSHNQSLAHPLGPWFPLPSPIGWYFEPSTA